MNNCLSILEKRQIDLPCLLQMKNAESMLEFERMAEISFEKRDFRMVSIFKMHEKCLKIRQI